MSVSAYQSRDREGGVRGSERVGRQGSAGNISDPGLRSLTVAALIQVRPRRKESKRVRGYASRYTSPWSSIALATFRKPPMLAPLT